LTKKRRKNWQTIQLQAPFKEKQPAL